MIESNSISFDPLSDVMPKENGHDEHHQGMSQTNHKLQFEEMWTITQ